ncbi:hypothetical protein BB561_002766 [Smittium simulii]|uniref:Dihydrolipoamide acetyltransferase component of pyruvate dehydrogenase complex n=1 Tax=Smittium simulii TaxID=133385 RepID=A0A2T9YP91_9FUNG|nr:hypothetical protein BB561_002766 [Smittium simulii]
MPALSPTMTEGKISSWLIKEGQSFTAGQPLLQIETDKAQMDVEAADDGSTIAILAEEGDDISKVTIPEPESVTAPEIDSKISTNSPETNTVDSTVPKTHKKASGLYSPSAHYLIKANKISNYSEISGTGPSGRVVKSDVLSFIATKKAKLDLSSVTAPLPLPPSTATKPFTNAAKVETFGNSGNYLVRALSPSTTKLYERIQFEKSSTISIVNIKKAVKSHDISAGISFAKIIASLYQGDSDLANSVIAIYVNSTSLVANTPVYVKINEALSDTTEEIIKNANAIKSASNDEIIFSIVLNYENELPQQLMTGNVLLVGAPFKRATISSISHSFNNALDFVIANSQHNRVKNITSSKNPQLETIKAEPKSNNITNWGIKLQIHAKDSSSASKNENLVKTISSKLHEIYA